MLVFFLSEEKPHRTNLAITRGDIGARKTEKSSIDINSSGWIEADRYKTPANLPEIPAVSLSLTSMRAIVDLLLHKGVASGRVQGSRIDFVILNMKGKMICTKLRVVAAILDLASSILAAAAVAAAPPSGPVNGPVGIVSPCLVTGVA